MRSVAEYLERAAEFEALAAKATVDGLRKRYGDIAACYRLLAKEREWLIGTGAIEGEQPIDGQHVRGAGTKQDRKFGPPPAYYSDDGLSPALRPFAMTGAWAALSRLPRFESWPGITCRVSAILR